MPDVAARGHRRLMPALRISFYLPRYGGVPFPPNGGDGPSTCTPKFGAVPKAFHQQNRVIKVVDLDLHLINRSNHGFRPRCAAGINQSEAERVTE